MPQLPQTLPDSVRSHLFCYYSFMWEASPEGMLGFALDSLSGMPAGCLSGISAICFLLDVLSTQCDMLLSVCLSEEFSLQLS